MARETTRRLSGLDVEAGLSVRRFWRELNSEQRRWIVFNALLVTTLINFVLNAGFAWLSVRGQHSVPLWALNGTPSTITDTVGTFFFLPVITCLIFTRVIWWQLRSGRLAPLRGEVVPPVLARLPRQRLKRGLALGGISIAVLTPPAVVVLVATDFGGVSTGTFVLYKAVLGVVLGALVTPVIAVLAMADLRRG